jgi:glycosyltransferase involved in cell wall biosynthesis
VVGVAPPRTRRVLVDVTQYVSWPATSGVQRALRHLAEDWPSETIDASYGFVDGGRYVTGPISKLGPVIAAAFEAASAGVQSPPALVRDALSDASTDTSSVADIERSFGAYLLPEPSLREDNLAVAARLRDSERTVAFFVYYDALPLTHPEFFGPRSDGGLRVTRYHRILAGAANVAFISQAVRNDFESRIARRKVANGIVTRPGADGLRRVRGTTPATPTFATVGTIEPRKRHRLTLEAFERLWAMGRDYELVVLGGAGVEQGDLLVRLRELTATSRVRWIEWPDDDVVAEEIARASAMLFPSEGEGYGLPPLEALALGCPVVVAEDLPALEGLPSAGQIRLRAVTVDTLASAVETLADVGTNTAYRQAIGELQLPTWRQFAHDIAAWIGSGLVPGGQSDGRHADAA